MNKKQALNIFLSLLLFIVIFFLYKPCVWSAGPAYMRITGTTLGEIEGSCNMIGREGSIIIYGFGHNIKIPTDPTSGLPSGKRIHVPLQILKEIDKSTPLLNQALCAGEHLNGRIWFYRIGSEGNEEHYYTIEFEDALITKVAPSLPTVFLPENERYRLMEIVTFTYKKIRWTWEDG